MRLLQILEANVAAKIKDPKMIKQIAIAMKHDGTLPRHKVAAMGTKPTDEQALNLWSELLDSALSRTRYGDISQDGKFDEWLTRLYVNGQIDYEDLSGESGDALGAWKALSVRGRLKPEHQDFNKFKSLAQIQKIVQARDYRDELGRIQNAAEIDKHKKEAKQITILDDKRFQVVIPFNYGSCYTFNNAAGFNASFCTGSSSGLQWFRRYADEGPVISVIDKNNFEDVDGKWQLHAPTSQINNGNQRNNGDDRFADLFPGLMKKIIAGLQANAQAIKDSSKELAPPDGYDIEKSIADLKKRFPLSVASESKEEAKQDDDGPGTYEVKHKESGRTANIPGESKQDVIDKVLSRYPNMTADDFEISKKKEQSPEGE
jgi:hypothetical protein